MKSFLALLLLALVLSPTVAFAEDSTVTPTVTSTSDATVTTTVSPTSSESHSGRDLKTLRTEKRNEIKTLTTNLKTTLTATREEMHTAINAFKDQLKMKRQEMQASMSAERQEFQTELKKIKDLRKKAVAEKINTKFNDINKNRTDKMAAALDKMSE